MKRSKFLSNYILFIFFRSQVRSVVNDTRQSIDFASMDLQSILHEFSSIS